VVGPRTPWVRDLLKCCLGPGGIWDKTIWATKMEVNGYNGNAKVIAGHVE
jgi:hypothetical protein